jgi:hypothetical protein
LLVFLLTVSIPLGWFAWEMQKARRQQKVVNRIVECGGHVTYRYEFYEEPYEIPCGRWTAAEPTTPAWLRKLLGDDFLADIGVMMAVGPDFGDAELEHVKALTNLGCIYLLKTSVTDAGLEHLKELTNLRSLHLPHTPVTNAGLEHLKRLINLRELRLSDTQVTGEGVKKLQEALPNCEIHY